MEAEARPARCRVDDKFDLVAVAVLCGGCDRLGDDGLGVGDAADAREGVDDRPALGEQLCGVGDVLPLASAAQPEVGTGRRHPIGRRGEHLEGTGTHEPFVLLEDLGLDGVTRNGARDERGATVFEVGDGVSAVC